MLCDLYTTIKLIIAIKGYVYPLWWIICKKPSIMKPKEIKGADKRIILKGILIIKPTRCTISQIYFGIELYMFRTGLLSIIRSLVLYTQQ